MPPADGTRQLAASSADTWCDAPLFKTFFAVKSPSSGWCALPLHSSCNGEHFNHFAASGNCTLPTLGDYLSGVFEGCPRGTMASAPPDLRAWLGNGPRSEPQTLTGTVAQWSERLPGMWMGVIGRMGFRIRAAGLLLVLAAVLVYAGGDLSGPSAPPILPAPLLPRGTRWQPLLLSRRRVRVPVITVRRFRSRSSHGGNTTATRQHGRLVCRRLLLLAGDIEVNPGPGSPAVQVAPPESASSLSVYHANVRSLKKQLGELRAFSPTLERHDVIAFTETWLNDTVATSELGMGLDDHTWFRRDRGSLGGGVACAVRSSLLPLRLPDPVDTETLLVRLRAVSVTLAVIYRPPDDDAAMEKIADALSAVQPPDCRLVAVGDLNVPELR